MWITAPAAHSKRLYRKCSGIRLALLSNFICRSTSDRELAFTRPSREICSKLSVMSHTFTIGL